MNPSVYNLMQSMEYLYQYLTECKPLEKEKHDTEELKKSLRLMNKIISEEINKK